MAPPATGTPCQDLRSGFALILSLVLMSLTVLLLVAYAMPNEKDLCGNPIASGQAGAVTITTATGKWTVAVRQPGIDARLPDGSSMADTFTVIEHAQAMEESQ